MEKFVISDEEFLEEVTYLVNVMWNKFSNLHKFMEKDDVISETMITFYGTDSSGVRRIDKYAEQGEKYFRNILRYMVEKEFQGFYWRNEHRKEEASLEWCVGDSEDGNTLGDLIPCKEESYDNVYVQEIMNSLPDMYDGYYYIMNNGQKQFLTTRDLVNYIVNGYKISDLGDFIYSRKTDKIISLQSLYNVFKDIKKVLKDNLVGRKIWGELMCEC